MTSLFGVGGVLKERDCGRIGTPEPWEKAAIDLESAAKLDLSLPCWDNGRRDSLFIQDPLDDMDARGGVSDMVAKADSPGLDDDGFLLGVFGDVTCAVLGRW